MTLRLSIFVGLFLLLTLWEIASGLRTRGRRFNHNIGLAVVNAGIAKGTFLLLAVVVPKNYDFGLLTSVDLPIFLEAFIGVVILDFSIWLQHRLTHEIPILWQLHKVHHSDLSLDVSSAVRFHPLEIFISTLYKGTVVFLLAPTVETVIIFEVILSSSALFNHSKIHLAPPIDKTLRALIVTPSVHLMHHSTTVSLQRSNFGFSTTLWDRMFRTYAKPTNEDFPVGVEGLECDSLAGLLKLPFRSE